MAAKSASSSSSSSSSRAERKVVATAAASTPKEEDAAPCPVSPPKPACFPSADLVPRRETSALEFLEKHPEHDGRGVLIGILDTGIDPGASGIRYLPDGTDKLVDMVDCTGSGDVDTSLTRPTTLSESGDCYEVVALSGKTLQLNKDWWKKDAGASSTPPTVRLGLKLAYELFPASVTQRVKAHRKIAFERRVSGYLAEVRERLSAWQQKHQQAGGGAKPTLEEARERDDLQARMDVLTDKEWDSEHDPGMLLDCVVLFDGTDHRAVVGIADEEGCDWRHKPPLAAYAKERRHGTVSAIDQYNYGVNFYEDGAVLSLVGDCTPHGTHVAAIAAAAASEGDDRSGVAPGAKLVSIKIGDTRMGSMETGTSIARGLMAAVKMGCDVINLSYGEGSQLPDAGRIIRMAEELVWRHNIVFVSAVGNNGPALSTLNAPGGLSSCILGVAAYASPESMKANHSLDSNTDDHKTGEHGGGLVGTTYTWSSVGPAPDGDHGVTICAPGGAITSVSNWTLQKSMLMNGTSMSSPHACGCVALLLSACKAEGIPVSPARIRRALTNTADFRTGLSRLQQGAGMVRVQEALEHLRAHRDASSEDVHYRVFLDGRPGNPRGVYLRQPKEGVTRQVFSVRVNPQFRRAGETADDADQKERIGYETKFNLVSTAKWVQAPGHLVLMNNGRSFKITVRAVSLPHGVHTAEVRGYDADHPDRGCQWSLPITVVKPMKEQQRIELNALSFQPAEVKRFFVAPPSGATWMDVTVRDGRDPSLEDASTRLLVLHTVQLLPHAAYRDHVCQKYLNLLPAQTCVTSIAVEGGVTCEVDLARYWSAAGSTKADVTIEFRGIKPVPSSLSFGCGDAFGLVRVHSSLKDESLSPAARLNRWKTPVRPKLEGIITPLGERDIQPWNDKKTYQLVLTYEFTQDEKGSFTPRAPPLQGVLYESVYESQLMLVFDGDKKYLGYCDAYPRSINAPKGTVVIKMQVRHDDPAMLEKLKDMTIWIERKIEKEISLSAFATREDLLIGGKKAMRKRLLRRGNWASVFFSEPAPSKIPSSCKSGDILMGNTTYVAGEASLPGDGKRPNGFPISYVVGPKMDKPPSDAEIPEPKDERTAEDRLNDAIRDLKVNQLEKLTKEEKENGKFEEMHAKLVAEYPSHAPLHMAHLKYLDNHKNRVDLFPEIVAAADKVLQEISEDELALHFGKKHDREDPVKVKKNKEMEKKKNNLIEAFVRKALVLADSKDEKAPAQFDETLKKMKAWVDIDINGRYMALALERDCRAGRHGLALKRINKQLMKNGKDTGGIKPMSKSDLLERRCAILKHLGYEALCEREQAKKFVAAPSSYKLF